MAGGHEPPDVVELVEGHWCVVAVEAVLIVAIGVMSSIVIIAVNPQQQFTRAYDAERYHNARELGGALYANLVDAWELPAGIVEGSANAKPICRESIPCPSGAVNLANTLVADYIAALPVDPVVPADDRCTGYMVYAESGRPKITAPNTGKLPGAAPAAGSDCGDIYTCSDPVPPVTWDANGVLHHSPGAGYDTVRELEVDANGKLLIGGVTTTANGQDFFLMRMEQRTTALTPPSDRAAR